MVYEIDLGGAPLVDPLVSVSESFDQPSSSSHINVASKEDAPAEKLLHIKAWLGQDRQSVCLLVDKGSACNLMSMGIAIFYFIFLGGGL